MRDSYDTVDPDCPRGLDSVHADALLAANSVYGALEACLANNIRLWLMDQQNGRFAAVRIKTALDADQ